MFNGTDKVDLRSQHAVTCCHLMFMNTEISNDGAILCLVNTENSNVCSS